MEKAWELLNVVHQRFCNTHHKQQTIAHGIRYTMPLMLGYNNPKRERIAYCPCG